MEYNKIIAVTGLPGLYELLSSKSDGAIVRSLDDKTTRFVSSRIHNFSHLESIEVYTVRDNVNLVDILKAMEDSKEKLPDDKDGNALKAYFTKVYPDLDFTRVYSSDLKKMVKWYAVLKSNNIEIKLSEPEEDGQESPEEAETDETSAAKPAPASKPAAAKPAASAKPAPDAKAKDAPEKKAAEKPAAAKAKAEAPEKKAERPAAKKAEPKAEKKAAAKSSDKAAGSKTAKAKKDATSADKPKKAAKKK